MQPEVNGMFEATERRAGTEALLTARRKEE